MGADLLTVTLWQRNDRAIYWTAGIEVAQTLMQEEVEALASQSCAYDEDSPAEDVREYAEQLINTLRQHIEGGSRVLDVFDTPDERWKCWLTGGMSWGDSPNELFDAMNDLYAVPRVLDALGFWTGEEATRA